jgi:hypothetical protein
VAFLAVQEAIEFLEACLIQVVIASRQHLLVFCRV